MIEQIQLKRGLLRLREVTVESLAAHANIAPATVKSFLHDHPRLVIQAGSAPAEGPGRPATIWKLRPDAETMLIEELRELRRASETEFVEEHNDALHAANGSIGIVLSAVEDLKRDRKSIGADRLAAAGRRLKRRIAATRVALNDLKNAGRSVIVEEIALAQAVGELDRLLAHDSGVRDQVIDSALSAVVSYFDNWFNGLRQQVPPFVTVENWFSPADVAAAPLLLIDGIAQVSDALSRQVVDTAKAMGAPVLHLAVGTMSPPQRRELFEKLGSYLAMAGGAATQIVCTVDSSKNVQSARGLARDFAALDHARRSVATAYEPSEPLAREVVIAVAPLITGVGVAATAHSTGTVPVVHPAGFVLAGMLNSRCVGAPVASVSANSQWDGYLHSVCVDSSTQPQLSSIFSSTQIDYVGASSFPSVKVVLPGPLPLVVDD
jgi:hypothetical protein